MLTNLCVLNYQRIKDFTHDLGPVTLIVGANGSGKSAVLRALKALCFNKRGDSFIQDGEDEALVSINVHGKRDDNTDGSRVVWTKPRKSSAEYDLFTWAGEMNFAKTGT